MIPPYNPSPWHTQGHKIIDSLGQEVYIRSIGTPAGEEQSLTGIWGGKGEYPFSYYYKWQPIDSNMQRCMDETLTCMRDFWYCNSVRIQGCVVNWWWQDKVNPLQTTGEGPDTIFSYRDYFELYIQRMQAQNMTMTFCIPEIFDYYTVNSTSAPSYNGGFSGGMPGSLDIGGKAFIATIDADEMQGWRKIWTSVVQRLGKYSNIMWELWNEPNLDTGRGAGYSDDSGIRQRYFDYMIEMYKTIRGLGDNHIILIQWDYGTVPTVNNELAGWLPEFHNQLKTAIGGEPTNIVYTTHCYRHAPYFLPQWGTTYAEVKAQLLSPNFVPITRSNGIDVPLYFDETGVMMGSANTTLQDDLGWFQGLLQASRELGVGINPEFWLTMDFWGPWNECLLEAGLWSNNTPSPTPTLAGQLFIDAYIPASPLTLPFHDSFVDSSKWQKINGTWNTT